MRYIASTTGIDRQMIRDLMLETIRDDVYFGNLASAEAVLQQLPIWIKDYNAKVPRKALNMLSPREYLRKLKMAG
ncbi:hypothetical protein PRO82_000557 [Candidatus Protochlamydia amoebophila]|nr:hypothetical protein [Candidatus Protochlamydia amoebophila]